MIVECKKCESKVDAKVICFYDEYDYETSEQYKVSLCVCPVCKGSLLAIQDQYPIDHDKWEWSNASRVWPAEGNYVHWSIPHEVRNSLNEAKKCFKATAYSGCAVMCGRAIEAICKQYSNARTLHTGLKKLKEDKIIDGRLYEWSELLRNERNLGAHASGKNTSREDANDILEFAISICEYVYVLTEKYHNYIKRKEDKEKK